MRGGGETNFLGEMIMYYIASWIGNDTLALVDKDFASVISNKTRH